jgi:hypothetical protein
MNFITMESARFSMRGAESRFRGRGRSVRDEFLELKQRGPQVLVTGDVPERVCRRATNRLLGHPDEDRHRVLALTDGEAAADRWLPDSYGVHDEGVTLIDPTDKRGQAASSTADGTADPGQLSRLVSETVDRWLPPEGAPPPAVLRLGVYSLESVLETEGVDAVQQLAYQLTGEVRRARGMGHYHLPREPDSEAVTNLRFVFDAQLELRTDGDDPDQRWRLPGRGTTDWVELGGP